MGSGTDGKGHNPARRNGSIRSANSRKCPACGRKSATKFISDEYGFGSVCRWCDYSTYRIREGR